MHTSPRGSPSWTVEFEPEVSEWIIGLSPEERARVLRFIDLLEEQGNKLRMPRSRSLGEGLFELRFPLGRQERRITYGFGTGGRIVLLTVFRKQRHAERKEIDRARAALERSKADDDR
ncbi:MAG: type II toxin-antitoxin system RelE/ParE family toxin [Egibacteraceae bacterium]